MRLAKRHLAYLLAVLVVVAVVAVSVVGCSSEAESTPTPTGNSPTAAPTPTPEKTYDLRFQHRWSAGESYFFDYFADIVREMSDGRLDITVYADGELMAGDDVPAALASGVLDMAMFHPGNFMGTIPVATIETIPFLWKNLDEFITLHYEMGLEEVYRQAFQDEFGVYLIGVTPNDYGVAMWNDEFSCLADLNGRKARMSGALANILQPYGVSAVNIPGGDIYTSLATGVVDGVSYGGVSCNAWLGFTDYAKYIMLPYEITSHSPGYWINADLWAELPDDLKAILVHAVDAAGLYMRHTYAAAEADATAEAVANGCHVVQLPPEDVEALSQGALAILEDLKAEGGYAEQGVEIVENALKEWGYIE